MFPFPTRMARRLPAFILLALALAQPFFASAQQEDDLSERVPANFGRGLRTLVREYKHSRRTGSTEEESRKNAKAKVDRAQQDEGGRILVDVTLTGDVKTDEVRRKCEAAGGSVTAEIGWYRKGLLSVWAPLNALESLAAGKGVRALHLAPRRQLRAGLVTSQGAAVVKSTVVNAMGYNGEGVTIGAISDSFNEARPFEHLPGFTTAEADVKNGDLPGAGNPDGYTDPVHVVQDDDQPRYDTDEGRAMLQIVHDVAPAAKLAFSTCGNTDAEFAANIEKLRTTARCQIMCDDIGFPDEPMYSDGVIAQAINSAVASGVTYFSAIGNDGNSGYEATFNPVEKSAALAVAAKQKIVVNSIPAFERNQIVAWHAFGTDASGSPVVVQNIKTGRFPVTLVFQWNDPFDLTVNGNNGVTADYDILIFNGAGAFVESLSGIEDNSSTNEPIELPPKNLHANASYKVCIVLTNRVNGGNNPVATRVRYIATNDSDSITGDYITLSNVAAFGHAAAADCIGVAAYNYDAAPDHASADHVYSPLVESYSSNGPVDIYFDANGNRLASPITRMQPVIAAPDNADTSFFPYSGNKFARTDYDGDGFPNFPGTSAATPHAAAVAGLLIGAALGNHLPVPSPAAIRNLLASTVQGVNDQDPIFSKATAGPVTVSASGDQVSVKSLFTVAFAGSAGDTLTGLTIDLSPLKMHFDQSAHTGKPFTFLTHLGNPFPAVIHHTLAKAASANDVLDLTFAHFGSGDSYGFSIGFDDDDTGKFGFNADELPGTIASATGPALVTAAVVSADGSQHSYTGTFVSETSSAYNYKSGYGLIDASAALRSLLGK